MPRRKPEEKGSGHDLARKRGRHHKARSPETKLWEDEMLIPERPPWMDEKTYRMLADVRRAAEGREDPTP